MQSASNRLGVNRTQPPTPCAFESAFKFYGYSKPCAALNAMEPALPPPACADISMTAPLWQYSNCPVGFVSPIFPPSVIGIFQNRQIAPEVSSSACSSPQTAGGRRQTSAPSLATAAVHRDTSTCHIDTAPIPDDVISTARSPPDSASVPSAASVLVTTSSHADGEQ